MVVINMTSYLFSSIDDLQPSLQIGKCLLGSENHPLLVLLFQPPMGPSTLSKRDVVYKLIDICVPFKAGGQFDISVIVEIRLNVRNLNIGLIGV